MIVNSTRRAVLLFVILFALSGISLAQNTPGMSSIATQVSKTNPFVSTIFSDNMVLQRGKLNAIWGWSEPGDKILVQIGDQTASAVAGADRRWQAKIQPPPVGGPYSIKISGRQTVVINNVMVGDVWLCGGQSNMGLPLSRALNGADEVKAANYPEIRFFTVAPHPAYQHTDVVAGKWSELTPETADKVSATAYYFARRLRQDIHVPIGLLLDNLGGTPAEAWTSAEALRPLKDFDVPLAELAQLSKEGAPEYGNYIMHWYDEFDLGTKGNWAAPDLDVSTWKSVQIPGGFAELGVPDLPAVAWFRKDIVLPNPLPAGSSTLFLGVIEHMDTAFINGKPVGASAWVENPRAYNIGDGVLVPGHNIITIRVFKTKPDGGFMSKPEALHLVLGDKTSIPLAGEWKGQLSVDARPPHEQPLSFENWPVMPAVLYQGMLEPIAPFSIAGAIWYQGEQNSPRGYQYRKILPVMIADWRKLFDQGDFPFYIVSLPSFKPRSTTPVDGDEWAELRESQAITAASVPNSCLAVAIDTGDPDNIHPKIKQPVGERLALCALANYYGEKIPFSGPTLTSVERLPNSIQLHFSHTDGGLVIKGSKLEEFVIAGDDKKWYWADARIVGDAVVVSSPSVPNPKEVRYAWQSNPAATLFNGAGLPAAPFRTDTWPGMTDSHRPY